MWKTRAPDECLDFRTGLRIEWIGADVALLLFAGLASGGLELLILSLALVEKFAFRSLSIRLGSGTIVEST